MKNRSKIGLKGPFQVFFYQLTSSRSTGFLCWGPWLPWSRCKDWESSWGWPGPRGRAGLWPQTRKPDARTSRRPTGGRRVAARCLSTPGPSRLKNINKSYKHFVCKYVGKKFWFRCFKSNLGKENWKTVCGMLNMLKDLS